MEALREVLKNDQDPKKPKIICQNGKFTDKFLQWNKKQIDEGLIDYYADQSKIYNKITRRTIKNRESSINRLYRLYPGSELVNNVFICKFKYIEKPIEEDIEEDIEKPIEDDYILIEKGPYEDMEVEEDIKIKGFMDFIDKFNLIKFNNFFNYF